MNCQRLRVYKSLTSLSISLNNLFLSLRSNIEAILHFWLLEIQKYANRPHVPKFGDWTEDAPFTVVFEKASKSKKNMNVSNQNEYLEMNPDSAQNRNSRHGQPPNHNVRPRHERFSSREETEFRPSPAHNERNMYNRVRTPPTLETYGGGGRSLGNPSETNRRQSRDYVPVCQRFHRVEQYMNHARPYNGTAQSTPIRPINDQHHQPVILPSSPEGCCFPPWSRKGSYLR